MFVNSINEDIIVITIQDSIYSSDVVHKCFYWFSDKLEIEITKNMEGFVITIKGLPIGYDKELFLSKVRKSLIDYNTREIINRETKDIRTLLIAKAFANGDDFDQHPPGDLEDTVGFTPFDFK